MIKKILLIVILTSLNSCSVIDKLDDLSTPISKKLSGVWHLQKQYINGTEQQTSTCILENLFDIADNNILIFYNHELNNTSCKSSPVTGRWRLNGTKFTINWDQPVEEETSYEIEILELTDTTLKWKRKLRSGNYLEEIYN